MHESRRTRPMAMENHARRLRDFKRSAVTMSPPKFKLRLGSQHHLMLSGTAHDHAVHQATFSCRLLLRSVALQASTTGHFKYQQLRDFITTMLEIVASLRGTCKLASSTDEAFSIRVSVADTGHIVTEVKIAAPYSNVSDAVCWSAHTRFQTSWNEYYHPIDVVCMDVPNLVGIPGHSPTVEGRTKR